MCPVKRTDFHSAQKPYLSRDSSHFFKVLFHQVTIKQEVPKFFVCNCHFDAFILKQFSKYISISDYTTIFYIIAQFSQKFNISRQFQTHEKNFQYFIGSIKRELSNEVQHLQFLFKQKRWCFVA